MTHSCRFAAITLFAAALALGPAQPASAHVLHDAPLPATERDATAAATNTSETLIGTVHELVVEDPARGTSQRYIDLRLDDGTLVPLVGDRSAGLAGGERIEVSGAHNGRRFDVRAAIRVAQAPSPITKAEMEIEGDFAVLHADDFAAGRGSFVYEVHQAAGRVYRLHLGSVPRVLAPGTRVRVLGRAEPNGESIYPDRITILAAPPGAKEGAQEKAATANSVLVILANFSNTALPSFTPGQAQQVMTSNPDSVGNFFRETSYGLQIMNVTVTPSWVTMSMAQPATCGSSDWSKIGSAAEAAAKSLGTSYDPALYNFVVYLFPGVGACGWTGLAYISYPHKAWINGISSFKTSTIAHEMGHNFGLLHAGSLRCSGTIIGGSCSVAEYGDPFDTMGNQRAMHYNAMQKSRLNWIPASSVKTHGSGAAIYTLTPLEVAGGSTYAVVIPTPSADRTYWVEFRQPIGFDAPLVSYPNGGAEVRLSMPFESYCSGCDSYSDDTQMLDMTPGTSTFTDGTLGVGQTFVDPQYGIGITVVSASASALTVQVTVGGATATQVTTVTTVSATPNPSTTGTTVMITASVSGSAPTGTIFFTDNANAIAGCSGTSVTGSGNVRAATCLTNALAAGTHAIVANYSGDVANLSSTSAPFSQIVEASLVDHYYWSILRRAPDTAGKAYWDDQVILLQSFGVDVKQAYRIIGAYFFGSLEYVSFGTTDSQYVTDLYQTFFNRAPDATGFSYWTGQLGAGLPREVALNWFLFSTEFETYMAGLFGNSVPLPDVDVVVDFYRGILNRFPDSGGLQYWVGRVDAARCSANPADNVYSTIDAISSQFFASAEYVSRNRSNIQFVSDLYSAFLRRGADVSELTYWANRIDAGVEDRDATRREFLGSLEFTSRVNAVTGQGC